MKRLRLVLVSAGYLPSANPRLFLPLGLMSLAAYARERFDLDVLLIDQRAENCSNTSVVDRIAAFEPDVAGFGAMTPAAHLLPELTRGTRQALPRALIVLGGPFVSSASAEQVIGNTAADLAVVGEGEVAFEQILRAHLEGGGDFGSIPGLIRRDESGEAVVNAGTMPFIEDLDRLPFLAYDLVDIRRYWKLHSHAEVPPQPYVALMTSRGCSYQCTYCHQVFGKRFRAQSAARVVAEIEHYTKVYWVNEIEIVDDAFNLSGKRVVAFAEEVRRRNLNLGVRFANGLRADILTDETADALRAAGTYIASCALESGSPRIQQRMGKRLNIPRFSGKRGASSISRLAVCGASPVRIPSHYTFPPIFPCSSRVPPRGRSTDDK